MSRVPKAQRDARAARSRLVAEIAVSAGATEGAAGRKPESGARTPSGQLSRSKEATAQRSRLTETMEQPHRRAVAKDMRRDQKAESELGRMFLAKVITEEQWAAGDRYRGLMRDFSSVLATPMSNASALSSMVASGTEDPAEADYLSTEVHETPEERGERVLAAYDGATRCIDAMIAEHNRKVAAHTMAGNFDPAEMRVASRDVFTVLDAVALMDAQIPRHAVPFLRMGLTALVRRWRLADPGERPITHEMNERPGWGHAEKVAIISYIER